jgi:hypothetical protein
VWAAADLYIEITALSGMADKNLKAEVKALIMRKQR